MATNYLYPFITGEDLKKAASQINLNFDIDNIQSSLSLAADDLKDVISEDVYQLTIDHFNSGDYNPAATEYKNKLVNAFLSPLANMAMYHHFIWLQLNISNSGITVVKNDNETAAFKYQTDEAKDKLLQTAWAETSKLVDFLNKTATSWVYWQPATAYKAGNIVRHENVFYTANADFTSGDTFNTANWTLKPDNEVTLHEWTLSEQYARQKELIFTNYKDFDSYFGIDKNAAFYIRLRSILSDIIKENILPRTGTIDIKDDVLKIKVKRFLSYKAIADALLRMDAYHLPISLRQTIVNNMTNKSNDFVFYKEKLRTAYDNRAEQYLKDMDVHLASLKSTEEIPAGETPYTPFETNPDADKKYVSML